MNFEDIISSATKNFTIHPKIVVSGRRNCVGVNSEFLITNSRRVILTFQNIGGEYHKLKIYNQIL